MGRRRHLGRALGWLVLVAACVAVGYGAERFAAAWRDASGLTGQLTLGPAAEPQPAAVSDTPVVHALFEQHRAALRLRDLSPAIVHAVLLAEDRRFFVHVGIDPIRVAAACLANVRAGGFVQDGSTITQQLVRTLVVNGTRGPQRRVVELLLASWIEGRYTKQEILEAYLNRADFGNGYAGIEAAAWGYFDKPVFAITTAEAATLAALIRNPGAHEPAISPIKVRHRRDWVLRELFVHRVISHEQFVTAIGTPVLLRLADQSDA